jgi:hypothetical protein
MTDHEHVIETTAADLREIIESTLRSFVTSGGDGDSTGGGQYPLGSAIEESGGEK